MVQVDNRWILEHGMIFSDVFDEISCFFNEIHVFFNGDGTHNNIRYPIKSIKYDPILTKILF